MKRIGSSRLCGLKGLGKLALVATTVVGLAACDDANARGSYCSRHRSEPQCRTSYTTPPPKEEPAAQYPLIIGWIHNSGDGLEIAHDTETGCDYIVYSGSYKAAMTPRVRANGTPFCTPPEKPLNGPKAVP